MKTRISTISAIVAAALVSLTFTLQALAATVTYKEYKANIRGTNLALDVSGLHFAGNHRFPGQAPSVDTPKLCQAFCDRTPGCNAWTHCNKKEGCGSGCKAYAKANPRPAKGLPSASPDRSYIGNYKGPYVDPLLKFPIPYFGGLTGGAECNDDKWPWGLCSMKTAANPAKPQFFSNRAAEGWVSGVVLLPPACKGVSGVTCKKCLASKDPSGCLACAKAAANVAQIANVAGSTDDLTWTEGCAVCAGLAGALRSTCYRCVSTGSTCGQCTVEPYRTRNPKAYFNVAGCITCTRKSPTTYEECQACSQLKAPGQEKKCLECVGKLGKSLAIFPKTSLRRIQSGDFCSGCAQAGPLADRCIKCGMEMPYNEDCRACAGSGVSAKVRSQCFACAFKTKIGRDVAENAMHTLSTAKCAECVGDVGDFIVAKSLKGLCRTCLNDPNVPYKAKYYCNDCATNKDTPAKRNTCYSCIKKKGLKSYFESCINK